MAAKVLTLLLAVSCSALQIHYDQQPAAAAPPAAEAPAAEAPAKAVAAGEGPLDLMNQILCAGQAEDEAAQVGIGKEADQAEVAADPKLKGLCTGLKAMGAAPPEQEEVYTGPTNKPCEGYCP
jgi:hypothetical protein